jgi:GT2 family glycosyltransferase
LRNGADFTFSDGVMEFEDGSPPQVFAHDATAETLAHDNTILISGVCYRAALHLGLGGFDPALPYYADWDWYLRVARAGGRMVRIASPGVAIRIHGGNTSAQAESARAANLSLLARKHGLGLLSLKTHADFL